MRRYALVAAVAAGLSCLSTTAATAAPTALAGSETLWPRQSIHSPDGVWELTMQDDGNAVLFGRGHVARWSTETDGNTGSTLEMQPDGNLVVYAPGHRAIWSTGTDDHRGGQLELQNDGNLVLYAPGHVAVWATDTHAPTTYVALGDSYSSGEGNPPFDDGTATTKDDCHRSPQAWPRLLGVDGSGSIAGNGHLACSGAEIDDVLFRGQHPGGLDSTSQVSRLEKINRDKPVGVVTVTIGGNDLGFSSTLETCFVWQCVQQPEKEERKIDDVAARVQQEVIPAIHKAAPQARVVVVGYPRLFPRLIADTTRCGWLTPTELTHLNQVQDYLDGRLRVAATTGEATYVSVADALNGHELCSRDPWIYDLGRNGGNLRGHPLADGQRAIAAVVGASAGAPLRPPPVVPTF
ncbi:lysophospholipase L1-like esterase [Frankia torreyi]|uniref:Lysophospholipase L1-like esterase n=1 Tax=Frankia torreyi TaxID=1856 RepID=A0A0D8B8D3_9ACTN|nr:MULTISPECIES: GDSL-type esterase/lipase family protein [Frankia]KJE20543.1 lysophospholipase L1-like esterase [Frankia torreyi]